MNKLQHFFILVVVNSYLMTCSLIWELKPISLLKEDFKSELLSVYNNKSFNQLDYGSYSNENILQGGEATIKGMFVSWSNITLDSSSYSIDANGVQHLRKVNSDDFPVLQFEFHFDYQVPNEIGQGKFAVSTGNFDMTKEYTSNMKVTRKIDFSLSVESFSFLGNQGYRDLLNETIGKFTEEKLTKFLVTDFQSVIDNLFDQSLLDKNITFTSNNPEVEHHLSVSMDHSPVRLDKDNLIFYYSGKLNDHPKGDHEPLFDDLGENSHQIVVHRDVLRNLIKDLIDPHTFTFLVNQNNKPSNSYNMNIQFLGMIIPELYFTYDRSDSIYGKFTVLDFAEITQSLGGLAGEVTIKSEIYTSEGKKALLQFYIKLQVVILPSVDEQLNLNLSIKKEHTKVTKIIIMPNQYETVYKTTLQTWVEESFADYMTDHPYTLLKTPIPVGEYFTKVDQVKIDSFGLKLIGY